DFLFPSVSVLTGAGSVASVFGNYYELNDSVSAEDADAKALRSDWSITAQDVAQSLHTYRQQHGTTK
ncbi:MAG: hypothetical protein ACIWVG_17770, partial [Gloeotrichia echinulata HAB0833]